MRCWWCWEKMLVLALLLLLALLVLLDNTISRNSTIGDPWMANDGFMSGKWPKHNTSVDKRSLAGTGNPHVNQVPYFNFEEALLMANLASISYSKVGQLMSWSCPKCMDTKGLAVWDVMYSKWFDALGFIGFYPQTRAKVIVFRGTDGRNLQNWLENVRTNLQQAPLNIPEASGALVHAGFLSMWEDSGLKANMTRSMAKLLSVIGWDGPLYITGHSLGGAMASLCAVHMKHTFVFDEVNVYTFGSPRVGNERFKEVFQSMVTRSWRFTHDYDIVPSVPPRYFGFHHVPVEVWQRDTKDGKNSTYKVCNGEGEDPSCSRGACFLDLCLSIPDHLHYLHVHMGL